MAEVRDKASGQVLTIADDEIGEYVLKGFQVRPGTLVPVMVQGQLKALDAADVAGIEEVGGHIATGAQVAEVRKQREFGEGMGAVRGGAEALARGATVGLSDLAATGLGADAEEMRERRERGGALTTGLEMAGAAAPMFLTGGGGILARAGAMAAAPARGVAAAGRMVGEAATAALGGAGSRLARMAGTAAAGATEGAAFGAGMAASEAALEDSPLTAERLLTHVGMGAVLGGGLGGLLGGASRGPRGSRMADIAGDAEAAAVGPAGAAEARAATGAADAAEAAGAAAPGAAPGAAAGGGAVRELVTESGPGVRKFFKDLADDQINRIVKTFEPAALDDLAKEFAFSSGRPMAKHLKSARRFNGAEYATKIGQDMLDELPKRAGKAYQYLTQEEIHAAAAAARADFGQQMSVAIRSADDAAQAAKRADLLPDTDAIYAAIERDVLAPLEGAEAGASSRRIARELRDDIDPYFQARQGRVTTFEDLKAFQTRFSKTAENKLKAQTESGAAFKDARRAMEGEIETRIELAASELGLGGGYREAKSKFSSMKAAEEMTLDAITRDQKNRLFSLSDYLTGTSVMAGATALGAGPGALLLGLALGSLNKIARERGSAIAAGTLSRFAKTSKLQTAAEEVGASMKSAVGRAFDAAPAVAGAKSRAPKTAADRAKQFDQEVKEAGHLAGNPAAVAARVNEALGEDAAQIAPAMAAAAVATAVRGVEFLRGKSPQPELRQSDILSGQATRQRVSDTEQAKFLRYVDAVKNPREVIDDFGNGTVTPEAAEALRTVYPETFAAVEREILTKLAEPGQTPGYGKLVRMSRLLGRPLHPTMEPGFIAAIQAMHGASRGRTEAAGGAPSGTPKQMTGAEPTTAQRVSAGD